MPSALYFFCKEGAVRLFVFLWKEEGNGFGNESKVIFSKFTFFVFVLILIVFFFFVK